MALVDPDYLGEYAVLATWIAGALPWAGTLYADRFTVAAVRFLPLRVQYVFGVGIPDERPLLWAWQAPGFQAAPELSLGATLGLAALAVYAAALALSVAYYLAEERVEGLPVHPARLLGGSLAAVGLLATAAGLLFVRFHVGTTLPLGGPLTLVLAYPALRTRLP